MNEVKAAFTDKFTKKEYTKGDTYTHKDEKRVAFLVEKGFLDKAEVKEEPKGKATEKAEK